MWPPCSLLVAVPKKPVHYTVGIIPLSPHFLLSAVSYTLVKEQPLPIPTVQFPWTPIQENKEDCDTTVTTEEWMNPEWLDGPEKSVAFPC